MIPDFDEFGYLPPGIHDAAWDELVTRYGLTAHRKKLLDGMLDALQQLRAVGCQRAFIDGSFITTKKVPGDFDACWDSDGVDFDAIPDHLLITDESVRTLQKKMFGGELYIADSGADEWGTLFVDFFQYDRNRIQKGIIKLDLSTLP